MSQDQLVKLACKKCKRINYWTRKNKKKLAEVKLAPEKFCKWCRGKQPHTERKK